MSFPLLKVQRALLATTWKKGTYYKNAGMSLDHAVLEVSRKTNSDFVALKKAIEVNIPKPYSTLIGYNDLGANSFDDIMRLLNFTILIYILTELKVISRDWRAVA